MYKNVDLIIRLISFIWAYGWVITIPNFFRACVARSLGDDTPEQFGFLSLNPLHHADPIGFILLCFSSTWGIPFGLGRSVVINPFAYEMLSYPWLRMIVVYSADVVAHFFCALIGIVFLEVWFGMSIVGLVHYMIIHQEMSYKLLAAAYPAASSWSVSIVFVIIIILYLHLLLGVLYAILNGRDLYLAMRSSEPLDYEMARMSIANIIIPVCLLFLFAEPLRFVMTFLVSKVGMNIGLLLGLS